MSRYSDDVTLAVNTPYPISPDADNMFVSLMIINDTANILKMSLMGKESNYVTLPSSGIFIVDMKQHAWPFPDRARTIYLKSSVSFVVGVIMIQEPLLKEEKGKYITESPKGSQPPGSPPGGSGPKGHI